MSATYEMLQNMDLVPDPHTRIEQERRDFVEDVTLRLLWACAGGGDEGVCASAAIAVIRFAETDGERWTDRALRGLHRRICFARGLSPNGLSRYYRAMSSLRHKLFIPHIFEPRA